MLKISLDLFSQDAKNSSIVYTDAIIFLQNVMKEVLIKETNTQKKSPMKLRTGQGKNKDQWVLFLLTVNSWLSTEMLYPNNVVWNVCMSCATVILKSLSTDVYLQTGSLQLYTSRNRITLVLVDISIITTAIFQKYSVTS